VFIQRKHLLLDDCQQRLTTPQTLHFKAKIYIVFVHSVDLLAMYVESLKQLGLTEKEAKVYLMLLRIGPSPVSSLARRTNLKRVTVYSVLDSLMSRGLVSFEKGENGRSYIPHDPECLLYDLEKESSQLNFRIKLAKNCIDQLSTGYNGGELESQKMILYRGEKSVNEALLNTINPNDKVFVMFLDLSKKTLSAKVLTCFLSNKKNSFKSLYVCVNKEELSSAKHLFPTSIVKSIEAVYELEGDLIVQNETVLFISSSGEDLQMMKLSEPVYANYIKQVTFSPHLKELTTS
jgi:sugar-specific transcriptional regulator TrmB